MPLKTVTGNHDHRSRGAHIPLRLDGEGYSMPYAQHVCLHVFPPVTHSNQPPGVQTFPLKGAAPHVTIPNGYTTQKKPTRVEQRGAGKSGRQADTGR
jgi:hypothetical protein